MTVLMISMNSLFKKVRVMMVMVTKGICKIRINPMAPMIRVCPPNEIWDQLFPNVFVSASRDSNLSFLIVKVPKIWKLTPKWPLYWVRPPPPTSWEPTISSDIFPTLCSVSVFQISSDVSPTPFLLQILSCGEDRDKFITRSD